MKKSILIIAAIITISVFSFADVYDSYFSPGQEELFTNAYYSGMANTGRSLMEVGIINPFNSSANAFLDATTFTVNWRFDVTQKELFNEKYYVRGSSFPSFAILFPFTKISTSMGFGYEKIYDYSLKLTNPISDVGEENQQHSGALSKASFELDKAFGYSFAVGAKVNYLFGQDNMDYRYLFDGTGYLGTRYLFEGDNSGIGYELSLTGLTDNFNYALTYQGKAKISKNVDVQNYFTDIQKIKKDYYLPEKYGVGLTYNFNKINFVNFDFEFTNKESADFVNDNIDLCNGFKFGIGYLKEGFNFRKEFLNKFDWKMGYMYNRPIEKRFGEVENQHYFTLGVSRNLSFSGKVSLAFIYGYTESGIEKNNSYKLVLSLSDLEKWMRGEF